MAAPQDLIYLAGPADAVDRKEVADALRANDWVVINTTNGTLHTKLKQLLHCHAICLLDTWWTDTDSWMLQQVAGWLHMVHINPSTMAPEEMASRAGRR